MGWIFLLGLIGCGPPDAEAAWRAGEHDAAIAAWNAQTGAQLDPADPLIDVLARRSAREPVGLSEVDTWVKARDLLERAPDLGMRALDLSFDQLTPILQGAGVFLGRPAVLAVGRSRSAADAEPLEGGPLRYRRGVLVGAVTWSGEADHAALTALGQRLDADPPALILTLAASDPTGAVWVTLKRQDGVWWTVSASNAEIGARLLLAGAAVTLEGAAAAQARYGAGLWPPSSAR